MTSKDLKKLESIKDLVRDQMSLYEPGKFIRVTSDIFKDMDWLIKQLQRSQGEAVAEEQLEEALA